MVRLHLGPPNGTNPTTFAVGHGGVWIANSPDLLLLQDTDNDGKADKSTVFYDKLHCPTGFPFYNGGVLVVDQPRILWLKDTDGDDKADVTRVNQWVEQAVLRHPEQYMWLHRRFKTRPDATAPSLYKGS